MRLIDADAFDERVRVAGGMSEEELTEDFKDGVLAVLYMLSNQPTIQPDIVRCKDCKHNPKYEWFGCPMCHLSEKQRPETAWCWKAERRTDGSDRQTGGGRCD